MLVQRRCVACRNVRPQSEMLRIARVNNKYYIDEKGKMGGRGAHICKNIECIKLVIKKKLLNKSFKANLNADIYIKLEEYEKDY